MLVRRSAILVTKRQTLWLELDASLYWNAESRVTVKLLCG